MSLITRLRKQKAVYWSPGENEDRYGRKVFGSPVEIDCRWEDAEVEFTSKEGKTETSQARIFVDREVELGGLLLLGSKTDAMDGWERPDMQEGVYSIRHYTSTPNFKATEFLRIALI